jgi:hypothetical protein
LGNLLLGLGLLGNFASLAVGSVNQFLVVFFFFGGKFISMHDKLKTLTLKSQKSHTLSFSAALLISFLAKNS